MTFIAGYHDKRQGKVLIWEKSPSGQRVRKLYDPLYYFYVRDPKGPHRTVTGEQATKVTCRTSNDFDDALADCQLRRQRLFESDINPLERVLMDVYSTKPAPELTIGLLDIEVDYDPDIGFAGPKNAYAPINAVSLHVNGVMTTIAVPPKSWRWDEDFLPEDLAAVILVQTEKELLELLLDFIHPCDVLSGWNSEFFDMPYIARRVELILGKNALDRLSFEGGPSPRWTDKPRFKHSKETEPVIDLMTRVHLDYLRLFAKFDLTKRQSYSLDNVSFEELGENKVEYEGSLAELYNNDFVTFVRYNIHDVTLIVRLDAKFKYIELANQMVHMATINFDGVFGSVQLIDTAIINFAHNVKKVVVNDRNVRPEGDPVEGAIVVTPNVGFYRWIGACDINSLYPSTIRSLNLSLEKLVGQLLDLSNLDNGWVEVPVKERRVTYVTKHHRIECEVHRNETTTRAKWTYYIEATGQVEFVNIRYGDRTEQSVTPQDDAVYDANEYAWRVYHSASLDKQGPFANVKLDVKFDGEADVLSLPAEALVEYVLENKLAVSAFGTILDQSSQGLVPEVLTSWFFGRKEMQAEKKKYGKLKTEIMNKGTKLTPDQLLELRLLLD